MKAGTIVMLLSAVALSGCACVSQEYVDGQIAPLADRLGKLETRVGNDEAKIADLDAKVGAMATEVANAKADAANAKADAAKALEAAQNAQKCCDENTAIDNKRWELMQKK